MGKKGVKKTDPVTANFTFTFLEARETGVKAGKKVVIQWKRGEKKENHGHTDEVEVGKDGLAKFNKSCTLKTTIAPDGDKYEPKYLSISLREGKESLGKVIIDLGTLLVDAPKGKVSENLNKKKPPVLDYMVTVEVLKVGARKVAPSVTGSGKDKMRIASADWDLDDESGSEEEMSMAGELDGESGKEKEKEKKGGLRSLLRRESSVKKDKEKDKEKDKATSSQAPSSTKAPASEPDPYADLEEFGAEPAVKPVEEAPPKREKISRRESSVKREKDAETASTATESSSHDATAETSSMVSSKSREKISKRDSSIRKDKEENQATESTSSSEKRKSVTIDGHAPVVIEEKHEKVSKRKSSSIAREEPAVSPDASPQVQELQAEIARLQKDLSKAKAADHTSHDALEQSKKAYEAEQKKSADTAAKLAALETQLAELTAKSQKVEKNAAELEKKLKAAEAEKTRLADERAATAASSSKESETVINGLRAEIVTLKATIDTNEQESKAKLGTHEEQTKAHEARIAELEASNAELQTSVEEAKKEKKEEHKKARKLQKELEVSVAALAAAEAGTASAASSISEELSSAKASLAEVKKERDELKDQLASQSSSAEAKLSEVRRQLSESEAAQSELKEKLQAKLNESLETATTSADAALTAQIEALKSELEESKKRAASELSDREDEIESLKTDLDNAKSALSETEEEHDKTKSALSAAEANHANLQQSLAEIEKEQEKLKSELEESKDEEKKLKRELQAALAATAATAAGAAAAGGAALAAITSERDSYKSERDEYKSKHDSYKSECNDLKAEISSLESKFSSLESEVSSLKSENEELKAEKEKSQEQLEMSGIELSDYKQEMEEKVQTLEDKLIDAEKKSKKALKEKDGELAELTKQIKQMKVAAVPVHSGEDDDAREEALKRAEAISTELQNQIEAKDEELQELTDENTTLKKDVKQLKEALKQAKEDGGDGVSQDEFDSVKLELESLKTELHEEKLMRAQAEESSNQEIANLAKKKKAKIALLKEQIATLQAGGAVSTNGKKKSRKSDDSGSDSGSDSSSNSSRGGDSSALAEERKRSMRLTRKKDELDKLISTVYAVREIASCAELEPQLQDMVDWLSENDYFSDKREDDEDNEDAIDYLESVASAIQRQALIAQNINSLFAWVGQIGLVREAVVSKHGVDDGQDDENAAPTTQAFITAIEEATLAVYTALVNVAYAKLRPLCVPAFLAQKKPEMKKLLKFLTGAVSNAQRIHVHEVVLEQVFSQIFFFINCCIFNKMLEDKNPYCTPTNSFETKLALSQLEEWVQMHIGKSSDKLHEQMAHTYEAATMLSMDKKLFDDAELRKQIIPSINPNQLYTLIKNFKPDDIAPERVPESFLKKLKQAADASKTDLFLDPEARS